MYLLTPPLPLIGGARQCLCLFCFERSSGCHTSCLRKGERFPVCMQCSKVLGALQMSPRSRRGSTLFASGWQQRCSWGSERETEMTYSFCNLFEPIRRPEDATPMTVYLQPSSVKQCYCKANRSYICFLWQTKRLTASLESFIFDSCTGRSNPHLLTPHRIKVFAANSIFGLASNCLVHGKRAIVSEPHCESSGLTPSQLWNVLYIFHPIEGEPIMTEQSNETERAQERGPERLPVVYLALWQNWRSARVRFPRSAWACH